MCVLALYLLNGVFVKRLVHVGRQQGELYMRLGTAMLESHNGADDQLVDAVQLIQSGHILGLLSAVAAMTLGVAVAVAVAVAIAVAVEVVVVVVVVVAVAVAAAGLRRRWW